MTEFKDYRLLIESHEFSARINIASSRKLFMRSLESDIDIKSLVDLVNEKPEIASQILDCVGELCRISINPRYENPNDVAIAAYCWVLFQFSPNIGKMAAAIACTAKVTWWARETAIFILENDITAQSEKLSNLIETSGFL